MNRTVQSCDKGGSGNKGRFVTIEALQAYDRAPQALPFEWTFQTSIGSCLCICDQRHREHRQCGQQNGSCQPFSACFAKPDKTNDEPCVLHRFQP